MSAGQILFIDAYDSFSNNIISLLQQQLHVSVHAIKIDDSRFVLNDDAFFKYLAGYDAVVAGPGPGHPANETDVGLIRKLWTLPPTHTLPVLGICLGFQSLCLSHGGSISRLEEPRHGIVTPISHRHESIFKGIEDLHSTQYHSLHVQLVRCQDKQPNLEELWQPCHDVAPLAWDLSDRDNGPILMAAKHGRKPFWGVQFHPESICTNEQGGQLIRNWWTHSTAWNLEKGRTINRLPGSNLHGILKDINHQTRCVASTASVQYKVWDLPSAFDVPQYVSLLRDLTTPFEPVVLQSGLSDGRPINNETGCYSIIGLHDAQSLHVCYSCKNRRIRISGAGISTTRDSLGISGVYSTLEEVMQSRKAVCGPPTPFWGGLVGFISYEAGLESIDVAPSESDSQRADVWFVMVERSIVIDHVNHKAYVQSIRPNDGNWLDGILNTFSNQCAMSCTAKAETTSEARVVHAPSKAEYCKKVETCQAHLRAGSSYELCLTEQTTLTSATNAWFLYRRLSKLNPAPFGAYLRLLDATVPSVGVSIVGSSPERFLSWSRDGKCQFRPIKGTVLKTAGATKADAEMILKSKKEQAENLMIVDLIRHDLAGVPGVSNVRVPALMSIEEYATVFQLVSVIEGDLSPRQSGIHVLAASMPPGSMTGAPKKRSCELLKTIEQGEPRSIYSGVLGYLDVGGGGDFSVVIRTAFKWDDESTWRVGAGGAVTVLSTAEAEFEEMLTKRERLMAAFS